MDEDEPVATPTRHYITREELIGVDDLPVEDIEVPEWDAWVKVRALTKGEQLDIRRDAMEGGESVPEKVELLALVRALVEPPMTVEDIGILREKNAAAVNRLLKRVAVLAGMGGEEAIADAKRQFPE